MARMETVAENWRNRDGVAIEYLLLFWVFENVINGTILPRHNQMSKFIICYHNESVTAVQF